MRASLLGVMLLLSAYAAAVIETYEFSTPALEARYQLLSEELRCPKCQNQNIADSNAPISQDLRRLLHQQLEAGASDEEILEFMVARYGEFVRYRPAFNAVTAVLWLAPLLLLLAGVAGLLLILRGRRQGGGSLTADDEAQLAALLKNSEKDA
ncbi:cytochrome c-type biogenesis protein [Haliea salexigens]|nr:cytochrome c-type biogenesis protein [Haliea salexigens]MAA86231.1 cytochrome c-type biogenesis protein CcmH [Haliea sp.]